MPQPPQNAPDYQWVHIDDFHMGIVSQSNYAYTSGGPVPAMLGAAQDTGTYGCIALPNGGLGPIMGYSGATYNNPAAASGASGTNWITGFIVIPRIGGADELVYAIDNPASTTRNLDVCSTSTNGSWSPRVLKSLTATITSTASTFCFTGGLTTLINGVSAPGSGTVQAVLAFTAFAETSDATYGGGSVPYFAMYPDPTLGGSPTATPKDYTTSLPPSATAKAQFSGWMFTHSGRVAFAQASEFYWTSLTEFMASNFDQFYFTDPPNSTPVYGTAHGTNSLLQDIIYIPESPSGTGSFGSVSAGELFCVKHDDGGYIVSGDPTAPTVTWLGGVQPTFGADCMAASAPIGLIYMSAGNGAWLWNGGSQSEKVSINLNDDFWTNGVTFAPNIGPKFSLGVLGNLVFFPNNYVMDCNTGGFWRLDNYTHGHFTYYGTASDGNTIYAAISTVTDGVDIVAYGYSRTTPATTFQWVSYPLPPTVQPEYSVTIREIVVRAQGTGTITLTLTGVAGSTTGSPTAAETISSPGQPTRYIFDTGMIGAQDVYVTVLSTGSGGNPAPVIYSIDIAYEQESRLNAT